MNITNMVLGCSTDPISATQYSSKASPYAIQLLIQLLQHQSSVPANETNYISFNSKDKKIKF